MVTVTAPASTQHSTKTLAAAGQFRAIALWLNEPLIPHGVYIQVLPDPRPGRLCLIAEFERQPAVERVTQYICHLIWQLNSPLIEGIHLIVRPMGQSQAVWDKRIRIMTPALRERLMRQQRRQAAQSIAPTINRPAQPPTRPLLLQEQVKTLRALMLTGSAVAAFIFGCFADVLMQPSPEPTLPLQRQTSQTTYPESAWEPTNTADNAVLTQAWGTQTGHEPSFAATSISYTVAPNHDRPNVVNGALEPIGVIQHSRLPHPTSNTVTLVFGGDVDLDDLPYTSYEQDEQLLAGVTAYQQADLAMVNLDTPLATAATSLEEELLNRHRPDAINLLKAGGVDIVNLASDAVLAFGEQGLEETLETLDRSGIYRVGAGRSEREARRPEILDVKGQRIAYLSYDRNGNRPAHNDVGGINTPSKQEIIADIQAIRDEVDWIVVNYRWTDELPEKPSEYQTNLARLAIDQGADLVIGHHSHQLQGAEIYKDRPIAYSLGDFVFGQTSATDSADSAVLQVSLRDRQMKVDLIPVKVENGQPYQVDAATGATILNKVQKASQDFATPMPSSIVLDAKPAALPTAQPQSHDEPTIAPTDDASFIETDKDWQAPVPAPAEATPAPAAEPFYTMPEGPKLNVPLEYDGALDVEMEPIPEGLLDDWGPKDGSDRSYGPESALPQPLRPAATPAPSNRSATIIPPASDQQSPAIAPAGDTAPPAGAISPHSEPLVGPLSAAPIEPTHASASETAMNPPAQPQLAMPQTRIFKPLNQVQVDLKKAPVIDVKKQVAFTPFKASDAATDPRSQAD